MSHDSVFLHKNECGNASFLADLLSDLCDASLFSPATHSQAGSEHAESTTNTTEDDLAVELTEVISRQAKDMSGHIAKRAGSVARMWNRQLVSFRRRLRKSWGISFDLLDMLYVLSLEAGSELNHQCILAGSRDIDSVLDVLLRIHARSCQVYAEITCLMQGGFASGAHARWRSLHELSATAFFIKKYGEPTATRFRDHEVVDSYRALLEYQRHCDQLCYEPASDDEVRRLTEMKDRMVAKYPGEYFNEPYGWAGFALGKKVTGFALIEEASGIGHLRPQYKMASNWVHAQFKGTRFNIGLADASPQVMLCGPADAGFCDPGQFAAISLAQVTTCLLTHVPDVQPLLVASILSELCEDIKSALHRAHLRVEQQWASKSMVD